MCRDCSAGAWAPTAPTIRRNGAFGRFFETKVGAEMAEFLTRIDAPGNQVFWARDDDGLAASVSLDADDSENGLWHLRWFIAAARLRGQGVGARLVGSCVEAARAGRAAGIFLWTFAGLDAARRIYERAGFRLVREAEDTTWGRTVTEQRFELRF